jgi:O-antigen/teichoic acid export membrane protein
MSYHGLLAKRIGLVGVTNVLLNLNGIILLPILTKNLSISDYGIWVQIMVTIGLIPAIALLGLPYSMVRFLASVKEKKVFLETFYSLALTIVLAGLTASAMIWLLSVPISYYLFSGDNFIVQLLSFLVFIECLNSIVVNYFRAMQQIKKYFAIISIRISLNIILVAFFVIYGYGIHGAIYGLLTAALVAFLISASLIISEVGITLPTFKNISDYILFGMPTVPGNLSSWVVDFSDRYVIGLILGTAAVGYYSPGYTLGNMIGVFMTPVSFILPAVLSKHYDENNIAEVNTIMTYAMKYFLVLAIPSFFGLSILSKPMLATLSTPEIASNGYLITPFSALSALLLGAYAVIAQVIVLEKKTKITGALWTVAALLNLGLNLILVPHIGIVGAALTTLLASGFAFVVTNHYANKYVKLSFDLKFIVKSTLASVLMSIFVFWFQPQGALELMISVIIGALIYFFALFMLKGVSKREENFLRELLSSFANQ